ncbi:acyl-CoA synthetase (AMP-forming)/AMP-acid ligase II [Roseiarcus fermentans]|uniref:Acyl-CoA synthetase (AMP-forming)/AMP-acid ligase II n=1 Tax=Roseiarcus fermentans TaxID=1473586 RepID=A0A366ENH0_9HYPH|nr:class I adenylate-forming enzyme family protein [Roseiarcus fermentans]RBP03039.1 acyl-CoA synthetase (AMP-forming)/AMP-acid ligase II [Roseiarcus fermentans]
MDSWFDRGRAPATRDELHYGARVVRAFVERPESVHAMLESAVARRPDGVALVCGDLELTYRALDEAVGRVAGGLRALGVGKGDRVAMLLGNSVEFVVVLFAVARLGAVSVPLNIRHQLAENREIIEDCAARVVVHEPDLADRTPRPGEPPSLAHTVAVRRDGGPPLEALSGALAVSRAEPVGEDDAATILYTSGTTGRPKGAMLTHFSIAHSVIHYRIAMELTEEDRALIAVPMSHVTGLIALVDAMIHCAGTLVVMPSFKASEFIDLAARRRVTYSLLVPAMFALCLMAPNFAAADLSAWRVSGFGGAIMPEATLERIAARLPTLKLLNCYGATETTSPATIMPPDETAARKDSVGLAVPCGRIVVMDPDGVEARAGEPGEIWIGGAMVVPGYFNNPEATAREFVGGYWKSGDLGIRDADGYLRVVDRIKDVINRGGYKVFASEVENVLLGRPEIVEVAVVAKPCPVLGERVHAFVVLREAVEDSELQRHCAELLSDYKAPEAFHRVAGTLPRNANGKVLKRELRQALLA